MNARPLVLVLAVSILALGAADAAGGTKNVGATLTVKLDRKTELDKVKGRVEAKDRACEANRKVRLFHRPLAQKEESSVIATLRTDGKGKWTFTPKKNDNGDRYATPGLYRTKVDDLRTRSKDGRAILCKQRFATPIVIG